MESLINAVQFLLRKKITYGNTQEAGEATTCLENLQEELNVLRSRFSTQEEQVPEVLKTTSKPVADHRPVEKTTARSV